MNIAYKRRIADTSEGKETGPGSKPETRNENRRYYGTAMLMVWQVGAALETV